MRQGENGSIKFIILNNNCSCWLSSGVGISVIMWIVSGVRLHAEDSATACDLWSSDLAFAVNENQFISLWQHALGWAASGHAIHYSCHTHTSL